MSRDAADAYDFESDALDLDPFDFSGKDTEVPNLVPDIDWDNIKDWAPELEQVENNDGSKSFLGRKSDIAQATLYHLGRPLKLDNHAFMLPIYNDEFPRIVLKCSRQVAKCVDLDTRISSGNGSFIRAGEIVVGDVIASMGEDGRTMTTGTVSWVSPIRRRRMIRIRTRQGHTVVVARSHPMRTWNAWTKAGLLSKGSRIASVRSCGSFAPSENPSSLERIRLTAYLIGDGYLLKNGVTFTSVPGVTLHEFLQDLEAVGGSAGISSKKNSRAVSARVYRGSVVEAWLEEDGLLGCRSGSKFIPRWVFQLSRSDTAIFLNRLWSTDGHVKQKKSMSAFGYASISQRLILEVQALLWKFGIPSKVSSWKPRLYQGTNKRAYTLRIETLDGAKTFLQEIGCLGKSEGVKASSAKSNNNRDTYPVEIQDLISRIVASRGGAERYGKGATHSLRSAGLQEKLVYPPTKGKLEAYTDHFREDARYDQSLVDDLRARTQSDLYWDKVVSIEDLGVRQCIDFEVEDTHSFVANGLVTHNSTSVCNLQIIESMIRPHWRSLYVSPSALQTRQYSNEKLRPTIYDSPFVKQFFVGKGITDQVFEKTLLNGSYLFLRYAFLTAARARGIPASRVFFDECQDLLKDNIKVISQSLSASRLAAGVQGMEMLTGTPLTFDNTLETYWEWSTQNEWMVPCDCKLPNYWNYLSEDNIGKKGLICRSCGKPLNPLAGQWVTTNPGEYYQGYHISQLMVPWKQSEEAWQAEIVLPFEKWPDAKFFNEILGFSYDSAGKPITRADVQQCCFPTNQTDRHKTHTLYRRPPESTKRIKLFAGLDWGEGREEGTVEKGKKKFASWTVLTIGGYVDPRRFAVFYAKRFEGKEIDPEVILPQVLSTCNEWNVHCIGLDWGHGWGLNGRIFKARGRERAMQFAYSHNLGERKRWDADAFKWIINRNAALSQVFQAIKEQSFLFPEWSIFESFAKDILSVYVEYNELTRMMKYDHPIDQPDDALHSLTYAKLAADILLGRF